MESDTPVSVEHIPQQTDEDFDTQRRRQKKQFEDLTTMLQNYPFFTTVYKLCGKCSMK